MHVVWRRRGGGWWREGLAGDGGGTEGKESIVKTG